MVKISEPEVKVALTEPSTVSSSVPEATEVNQTEEPIVKSESVQFEAETSKGGNQPTDKSNDIKEVGSEEVKLTDSALEEENGMSEEQLALKKAYEAAVNASDSQEKEKSFFNELTEEVKASMSRFESLRRALHSDEFKQELLSHPTSS